MIGLIYQHIRTSNAYEVLDTPDGKIEGLGWVEGVYYKSVVSGKMYWSPLKRFDKKFRLLEESESNSGFSDPEEILP